LSDSDDKNSDNKIHFVIPFPQSIVKLKTSQQAPLDLSLSKLVQEINVSASIKGHWCSRCKCIGTVLAVNVNAQFVVTVMV